MNDIIAYCCRMKILLITSFILLTFQGTGQLDYSSLLLNQHISYLSSDELEGRLTGSKGEDLAANYISVQLKTYNLTPVMSDFIVPFTYNLKTNPRDPAASKWIEITGKNVLAYLNNGSERTILIGAHFDHLGRNEHGNSTAKNALGIIHNGADDNASGVASLLEIARVLSSNNIVEGSNFIFAFFSGEEDGLMGSNAAANVLTVNHNIVSMINLDMVGRLDTLRNLHIGGIGTSPVYMDELTQLNKYDFHLKTDSSGVGPSDHTSFYQKNIPVLFFFTGTHEDYHKPTDDVEKINFNGVVSIAEYVHDITIRLSMLTEIPFTATRNNIGNKPRYKVTLGIMPDYSSSHNGLKIDHVMDDRPAIRAGLLDGDILQKLDDCVITDVYTYMECLSQLHPGQTISVQIMRNNKMIKLKVEL
mgnify:CR=1 FL=1